MNEPRAILWDMDGTLIDSAEDHWRAWVEVFAEQGYEINRQDFTALFGRRNADMATLRLGSCPPGDLPRVALLKEDRYRQNVRKNGTHLLPGAGDWLARLSNAGWRQAIATAAPRANADVVMEALGVGAHFGAIIASEDVSVGKPDPAVFLLAAQRLGVPPSRSIVLEDAPAGIEGARRAGMKSVGICTLHPDLPATIRIKSFQELPDDAMEKLLEQN